MRASSTKRLAAVAVAGLAGTLLSALGAVPALAADCEKPSDTATAAQINTLPWAQGVLEADKVWSMTTGKDITVAVIDSGVQADHPVFGENQVKPGKAYIDKVEDTGGSDDARVDCVGHGTAVAGIIAGKPTKDTEFAGIAPDATILPVRVANKMPGADQVPGEDEEPPPVSPNEVAEAIRWAADNGADVINLSLKYSEDYGSLKSAIAYAISEDIVVVASGGNNNTDEKKRLLPSYPAAYEGVIGVGAVDENLIRLPDSQEGDWIDIVGPGARNVAPQFDGNYQKGFGATSGATAFVSGTAALVRAYHPDWTQEQVTEQILKTASAVGANMNTAQAKTIYGHGMVDPVMAVTEVMRGDAEPAALQPMDRLTMQPEYIASLEHEAWATSMGLWIGLGGFAAFIATLFAVGAMRRGRGGKWRTKKASRDDQLESMDDGDPIPLYQGIKGIIR